MGDILGSDVVLHQLESELSTECPPPIPPKKRHDFTEDNPEYIQHTVVDRQVCNKMTLKISELSVHIMILYIPAGLKSQQKRVQLHDSLPYNISFSRHSIDCFQNGIFGF